MKLVGSKLFGNVSREQAESAANEELEARIQQGRPSDEEFEAARRSWVLDEQDLAVPEPSRAPVSEPSAVSVGADDSAVQPA